jgi:hypothetical protein
MPTLQSFTGADAAAASAYLATADALLRLQATTEELETHLELCGEFAVGHAYAACIMSLAGESDHAARRASIARSARSGATRRERQLIEILLLTVDGDRRRSAALAAEHTEEFADDAAALTIIERWFQEREPT